jgi:Zn-dependent protease with chaperone function
MPQQIALKARAADADSVTVIPDRSQNAFTAGRNPQYASVAATEGILQVLAPHELEVGIAHELAHARHRDTLISSVAATIAAAVMMVARMAMYPECSPAAATIGTAIRSPSSR